MAEIEMYYSEWCGYCHRARRLLELKGVPWTGYDVDMEAGKRREMQDRGGGSTVPQVFVDGEPIGGWDELFALEAEGRLDGILGLAPSGGDTRGNEVDDGGDGA